MRRYEAVVIGDPDLVLDLLRSTIPGADGDRFELDAGVVPGTRHSTARVEGRFERTDRGIRVVADAGAQKTHTASTALAVGLVLLVTLPNCTDGSRTWWASAATAAFGVGVLVLYHRWTESKAADHARRRLDEHLLEVRQLLALRSA